MKNVRLAGYLLAVAILAAPSLGWSQAAAPAPVQSRPDVLPDVTITGRQPAPWENDVVYSRMPRVAVCARFDTWSPDPTGGFNKAYYEEMTGQSDYYDTIRPPKRKVRHLYPPSINHTPEMFFAILSKPPGEKEETRPLPDAPYSKTSCLDRGLMERNTTFARALAMFDRGEHAPALEGFKTAYHELGKSPMAGEAALMIAVVYMKDEAVPRDMTQAIAWLEKAYKTPYTRRDPISYNPRQPDRFYRVAAEAAYTLGRIYLRGAWGVPQSTKLARQWVERAQMAGHIPAFKVVGDMDYVGYDGRKNLRDALMSYEYAGHYRHGGSLVSAASMYELGEGTGRSASTALKLYGQAAEAGDATGLYVMAAAYDRGKGVKADPARALAYYRQAALKGEAAAQTAIGTYFYEGGSALGKDHVQARAWFTEAATRGDADGMVNLAAMLTRGEGGEADPVKAWAWLAIAREGGREDVAAGLGGLEKGMSAEQLANAKALVSPKDATPGAAGG